MGPRIGFMIESITERSKSTKIQKTHLFLFPDEPATLESFRQLRAGQFKNVAFFKGASRCMIEATGDIRIQHEFGLIADGVKDGFFGILGATARTKSIAVRFKAGFPLWFQSQLDEALMRPIKHNRNP